MKKLLKILLLQLASSALPTVIDALAIKLGEDPSIPVSYTGPTVQTHTYQYGKGPGLRNPYTGDTWPPRSQPQPLNGPPTEYEEVSKP